MAQQHTAHGYDDLIDCINRIKGDKKPINIYFTGSKDDTGKSWCPDCVEGNEKEPQRFIQLNLLKEKFRKLISFQLNHFSTRHSLRPIQIQILSIVMSVIDHCK